MEKTTKVLFTALIALGFGSIANAQSASISANATVISQLLVKKGSDLNFGTVVTGQTKSIAADDFVEVSSGPILGNTNRGSFEIFAQDGSNVKLSFGLPSNLINTNGDLLPISFIPNEKAVASVEDVENRSSTAFDPRSDYQISNFNSLYPYEKLVFVYIGGLVNATGVPAGSYTGSITLSATYN